jgi:signal transduction histidine kinase
MADAARRITAASRGDRLPIANPTDELGRLGGTVNALLDRLDDALGQQRRFLADAAHELRTPIARMRAMLDVAPATGSAPLRHEVAQLATMVDELLLLARADAAPVRLALVPLFLDDVVMEALPAWNAAAMRAGVALEIGAVEEAPARLDQPHVARLLGVLVDNAIRYTPAGGHVRVSVTAAEAPTLVVEDDGIGIPPAERALVTARFHRGAAARQRVPDGSGLGLAIAEWIVAQHGGALAFEPGLAAADRVGTRVVVRFPAVAPTMPDTSAAPSSPARAPR